MTAVGELGSRMWRRGPVIGRAAVAAALVGVAVCGFVFLNYWRSVEAEFAAHVLGWGTSTSLNFHAAVVYLPLGHSGSYGLQITAECCSALLVAPAALLAAVMTTRRRVPLHRILAGFTAAVLLVLASNQIRLAVIAWFIHQFGFGEGYRLGHAIVGSLITLFFAAMSIGVLLWVALAHRGPSEGAA